MANNKSDHDDDNAQKQREEEEKRQRDQQQRQRQEAQRQQQSPENRAAADQQAAQTREAQAAASIGAQIILDYNEDGSKGARGGAGGTIEENQMARDAHLVAMGLDPVAPSGPPPTPEALAARRKREEEAAREAADPQFMQVSGKATRMSSLAAGINAGDIPPPVDPPVAR